MATPRAMDARGDADTWNEAFQRTLANVRRLERNWRSPQASQSSDGTAATEPSSVPAPPPAAARVSHTRGEYERLVAAYGELSSLARDFVSAATQYGRVIISEKFVPNEGKTIKPSDLGGVAGGDKFVVRGLLFKFAVDAHGIFSDDAGAAKAAGHELRALAAMHACGVDELHLPLCAIIDYKGWRLLAFSVVPVRGGATLVYGSADAGRTVAFGDAAPSLRDAVTRAGAALNLAPHPAGPPALANPYHSEASASSPQLQPSKSEDDPLVAAGVITGPTDMEGHIGSDGRFYLLDLARLFPPERPAVSAMVGSAGLPLDDRAHLVSQLRPELVAEGPTPLSSDAFSWFGMHQRHKFNADVAAASRRLRSDAIPRVAALLHANAEAVVNGYPQDGTPLLVSTIHSSGVNCRHLGRVLVEVVAQARRRAQAKVNAVAAADQARFQHGTGTDTGGESSTASRGAAGVPSSSSSSSSAAHARVHPPKLPTHRGGDDVWSMSPDPATGVMAQDTAAIALCRVIVVEMAARVLKDVWRRRVRAHMAADPRPGGVEAVKRETVAFLNEYLPVKLFGRTRASWRMRHDARVANRATQTAWDNVVVPAFLSKFYSEEFDAVAAAAATLASDAAMFEAMNASVAETERLERQAKAGASGSGDDGGASGDGHHGVRFSDDDVASPGSASASGTSLPHSASAKRGILKLTGHPTVPPAAAMPAAAADPMPPHVPNLAAWELKAALFDNIGLSSVAEHLFIRRRAVPAGTAACVTGGAIGRGSGMRVSGAGTTTFGNGDEGEIDPDMNLGMAEDRRSPYWVTDRPLLFKRLCGMLGLVFTGEAVARYAHNVSEPLDVTDLDAVEPKVKTVEIVSTHADGKMNLLRALASMEPPDAAGASGGAAAGGGAASSSSSSAAGARLTTSGGTFPMVSASAIGGDRLASASMPADTSARLDSSPRVVTQLLERAVRSLRRAARVHGTSASIACDAAVACLTLALMTPARRLGDPYDGGTGSAHALALVSEAQAHYELALSRASATRARVSRRAADSSARVLLAEGHANEPDDVSSMAHSLASEARAALGSISAVRRWASGTGDMDVVGRHGGHTDRVYAVALSRCGRWMFTGSKDNAVGVWDMRGSSGGGGGGGGGGRVAGAGGSRATVLRGHEDWVRSLVYLDAERVLLSTADHSDGCVRFWTRVAARKGDVDRDGDTWGSDSGGTDTDAAADAGGYQWACVFTLYTRFKMMSASVINCGRAAGDAGTSGSRGDDKVLVCACHDGRVRLYRLQRLLDLIRVARHSPRARASTAIPGRGGVGSMGGGAAGAMMGRIERSAGLLARGAVPEDAVHTADDSLLHGPIAASSPREAAQSLRELQSSVSLHRVSLQLPAPYGVIAHVEVQYRVAMTSGYRGRKCVCATDVHDNALLATGAEDTAACVFRLSALKEHMASEARARGDTPTVGAVEVLASTAGVVSTLGGSSVPHGASPPPPPPPSEHDDAGDMQHSGMWYAREMLVCRLGRAGNKDPRYGHTDTVTGVAWLGRDIRSALVGDVNRGVSATRGGDAPGAELGASAGAGAALTLATSSFDCTVRLWAVPSGECLSVVAGHSDGLWAVQWAPYADDGGVPELLTASSDGTMRVWRFSATDAANPRGRSDAVGAGAGGVDVGAMGLDAIEATASAARRSVPTGDEDAEIETAAGGPAAAAAVSASRASAASIVTGTCVRLLALGDADVYALTAAVVPDAAADGREKGVLVGGSADSMLYLTSIPSPPERRASHASAGGTDAGVAAATQAYVPPPEVRFVVVNAPPGTTVPSGQVILESAAYEATTVAGLPIVRLSYEDIILVSEFTRNVCVNAAADPDVTEAWMWVDARGAWEPLRDLDATLKGVGFAVGVTYAIALRQKGAESGDDAV